MGTSDILFLLGLGLHLAVVVLLRTTTSLEDHATHDDVIDVTHYALRFSGGTNERG